MAKAKKSDVPAKMGRPTLFSERLVERLIDMAKLGATNEQMAEAAGVNVDTLYTWKGRYPDFSEALKDAKSLADILVEASLYRKATSGDTTACIFWLKNRQPQRWRDRQELQVAGIEPFVITRANGEQTVLGAKKKDDDD